MYPTHRLETPPPASRFRRPWSPEPFDPNPGHGDEDVERGFYHGGQQRREPSDVSVEALDLADYALTLARQRNELAAPVFQPYAVYPPSPVPFRSLSSRASTSTPPLLSYSPSAANSYSAASSRSSAQLHTNHRAFSLPAPAFPAPPQPHGAHSYASHGRHAAADPDPDPLQTPPLDAVPEIDIAQFPAATRGWYAQPKASTDVLQRYAAFERDPFDPAFPTDAFGGYAPPPPLYASAPVSSYASHSSNNVHAVPWNADPPDGRPVDKEVKEERVRMLERMFGGQVGAEDEEHAIGSVNAKGRLITEGPRKRLLVRWIQVLFALLAGGSGIYAAAFIKTSSPPPPAGKPPAYILYIFSVITFLLTTYLFILYPICCGARRRKSASSPYTEGPGGMMVLPVQGPPGGKKNKGNKKNSKEGEGVQVNLIVDPGMFNGDRDDDDADDDESDSEFSVPGTYSGRSRRSRRNRRAARRRGIFAGLALEAQWKHARKMLKWGMAVDVLMFFAWAAEFVYILIGKRCPSGSFDGWCDAYNVATAAACLLCFAFGFSIFFDVKDLHASQASPRTRSRS
ncbi:hypothetical protein EIP86_007876 [Pleurotus ostreatoroseus]|nr:hypothetical protein EIP86_007876 [Pleurotus ostreatoroseus]